MQRWSTSSDVGDTASESSANGRSRLSRHGITIGRHDDGATSSLVRREEDSVGRFQLNWFDRRLELRREVKGDPGRLRLPPP